MDIILTVKLISCANIVFSCFGAVMFASALAMLLVLAIFSVSFNSFIDELRIVTYVQVDQ